MGQFEIPREDRILLERFTGYERELRDEWFVHDERDRQAVRPAEPKRSYGVHWPWSTK